MQSSTPNCYYYENKLKQKKLNTGKISLYLEYYKGSYKDENGKEIHNREFEYLSKEIGYLIIDPLKADEKKKNKEILELAENILAIRKSELLQGKFGIVDRDKSKISLTDYFDTLKEHRSSYLSNYGTWKSVKRYIDQYFHSSTTLSEYLLIQRMASNVFQIKK